MTRPNNFLPAPRIAEIKELQKQYKIPLTTVVNDIPVPFVSALRLHGPIPDNTDFIGLVKHVNPSITITREVMEPLFHLAIHRDAVRQEFPKTPVDQVDFVRLSDHGEAIVGNRLKECFGVVAEIFWCGKAKTDSAPFENVTFNLGSDAVPENKGASNHTKTHVTLPIRTAATTNSDSVARSSAQSQSLGSSNILILAQAVSQFMLYCQAHPVDLRDTSSIRQWTEQAHNLKSGTATLVSMSSDAKIVIDSFLVGFYPGTGRERLDLGDVNMIETFCLEYGYKLDKDILPTLSAERVIESIKLALLIVGAGSEVQMFEVQAQETIDKMNKALADARQLSLLVPSEGTTPEQRLKITWGAFYFNYLSKAAGLEVNRSTGQSVKRSSDTFTQSSSSETLENPSLSAPESTLLDRLIPLALSHNEHETLTKETLAKCTLAIKNIIRPFMGIEDPNELVGVKDDFIKAMIPMVGAEYMTKLQLEIAWNKYAKDAFDLVLSRLHEQAARLEAHIARNFVDAELLREDEHCQALKEMRSVIGL